MSVVTNLLCRALESAISVRQTLDFRAARALATLENKIIQIESSGMTAHLHVHQGRVLVREGAASVPDLVIKGPLQRVTQALVLGRMETVTLEGDDEAMRLLTEVFVPPVYPAEFGDRVMETAEASASLILTSLQAILGVDQRETEEKVRELNEIVESMVQRLVEHQIAIDDLKKWVRPSATP